MESDIKLINDIRNIRSSVNIRTIDFLKFIIKESPDEGKKILNNIQQNDSKIQELSDLLHMKKKRTDIEILNEIEQIRSVNNTLWMDVVRLCFEIDPKKARLIFAEIKECDRKIQELSKEISDS